MKYKSTLGHMRVSLRRLDPDLSTEQVLVCGGSDASEFNAIGLQCSVLGVGAEAWHSGQGLSAE